MGLKRQIFDILEEHNSSGFWANVYDMLVTLASFFIIVATLVPTFEFFSQVERPIKFFTFCSNNDLGGRVSSQPMVSFC